MSEGTGSTAAVETEEYVRFWGTGEPAKGEFHCAECGYGVTIYTQLPTCPMCSSESWEQTAWSPFARATAFADL
jgi:rubrerythrin